MKTAYLFLPLFLFQSLNAAPSLYRWQDENGQFHFSDKAPVRNISTNVDKIESRPINSMNPTEITKFSKRPTKDKKSQTNKPNVASSNKRCIKYQLQLDKLRSKMRIGYSAVQAPKLLQKERELKEKIYHQCRKDI